MNGVAVALNAYLKLVGTKQGEVKGSVTQKGREGKIMVIAMSHQIATPQDPSGQSTGKHGPRVITKKADRATVPLRTMLVNNELAKDWELQFWRPSAAGPGTGVETQHFTIRPTDAVVVSIDLQMPNNKHPDLAKLETFEQVASRTARSSGPGPTVGWSPTPPSRERSTRLTGDPGDHLGPDYYPPPQVTRAPCLEVV